MTSSTEMVQALVSSTGEIVTEMVPVGLYLFGFLIAAIFALLLIRTINKGGKKLAR